VREEVLSEMIQSTFYDAVRDENLKLVAQPNITVENAKEGEGFKYVAHFEVLPEFVLYPLESMEVRRFTCEVSEEDIDAMLERLREQRKTWNTVERPAATGDLLLISFEGVADGESFTNGKVENVPFVLGSNQFVEGFEEQLLGTVAGTEATVAVTFPEDYNGEKLAGKTAEFKVQVHQVQEGVLPALDAEFAKALGVEEGDLDELRQEVKSSMEREKKHALTSRNKDSALSELYKRNSALELPKVMLDGEINAMLASHKESAEKRGQAFDEAEAKIHIEPVARRRVTLGLLLNRIIETNDVKLDADRVRATINDLALSYEDPQQVVAWYYANRDQLSQVQGMVMEDQVVDLIMARSQVIEEPILFSVLMNQSVQA
jgi:trigger factor